MFRTNRRLTDCKTFELPEPCSCSSCNRMGTRATSLSSTTTVSMCDPPDEGFEPVVAYGLVRREVLRVNTGVVTSGDRHGQVVCAGATLRAGSDFVQSKGGSRVSSVCAMS